MKRRNLILLLGGASSGAMSVGTGAFSSVEADRGVEVNVVKDENAYLGLDDDAGEGIVRITNQFAGDLDLTVTASLESGDGDVEIGADEDDDEIEIEVELGGDESTATDKVDVTIPTGNSADVIAECDGSGSQDLELSFMGEITDTGTTVDKTREFSIGCEVKATGSSDDVTGDVTKVKFPGNNGKVKILTTENNGGGGGVDGEVSAKLYCQSDGDVTSSDYTDVSVNDDLDSDDFDGECDGSVVGVRIENVGVFEKSDRGSGNIVSEDAANDDPSWE